MSIHIYNSLTKKKETLTPLSGKTVTMYSCGVTVYDKCHIGHARSLYIFDVIRRYLAYRGYAVRFIRNITDVDDKIINKGKELKKSFDEVVRENIEAYERDLKNLGVDKADVEPRATQYIPKMIAFITALMEKGFAYEVDGDVYFSVRQFKGYGKLSGQSIDQMIEATRIEQDPKKRDPLDFALWKKTKEDEKSWPSPWGPGRPGWHIECSCMSMNELDSETIDIHAGGRDLIFPHHENEIAQSEALTGKTFAKVWIHHGLLTIDGQKMSKSLGNFITLDEIFTKYSSDVLKLFFLQSHYASPIDFSWEKMEEVKKTHDRISILIAKLEKIDRAAGGADPAWVLARQQEFTSAMDDDFNTPKALSVLHDIVGECNKLVDREAEGKQGILRAAGDMIKEISRVFSLDFVKDSRISDEEEGLLLQRIEARKRKDFRRSDELRVLLKKKGIIVEDTKDGQVWRRE
ncbi:MAG TPA: cysteine--tRNA ligase [Candidatus Omnitrophota bacterium]|nr:cysteine--tRNA ligase [Candidatus Omnitrophota bacterium]